MKACCIVYTTDTNYLFPTLVSAMQARQFTSSLAASVYIYCVDMTAEAQRVFAPVCELEKLHLVSLPSDVVEGQNAMLARFFLNRFVPAKFDQYLYLDGDVHIVDSLDPLIEASVPVGHFLAANDPFTFLLADGGYLSRDLGNHLRSLGLTEQQSLDYFNSGVLRIARQGWDSIGEEAWDYCRRGRGPSRFPDQDALNLVSIGRRLPLSLAWNFPVFMRNSRVEERVQPKITHFMSSPKPWHGVFPPWKGKDAAPYAEALHCYPQLARFTLSIPVYRRLAYQLQQRGKQALETVTWGYSDRRRRILSYESACSL